MFLVQTWKKLLPELISLGVFFPDAVIFVAIFHKHPQLVLPKLFPHCQILHVFVINLFYNLNRHILVATAPHPSIVAPQSPNYFFNFLLVV